ncbi:MAG: chemotaxis protein CheW [Gammaproteobacteria bacterium]|nr:chemotaxis protein CheW [Gammaproteobacteria bacterium]
MNEVDVGPQAQNGTEQYLTFMLAREEYGVSILCVQEIKGWHRATPLPNSPEYVLGVINLRGTVVPIVDLRTRFGLPEASFGPTTVIVIVKVSHNDREKTIGIVVDAVSEVYNISQEELAPAPGIETATPERFIKGFARLSDRLVILLDCENLLPFDDAYLAR